MECIWFCYRANSRQWSSIQLLQKELMLWQLRKWSMFWTRNDILTSRKIQFPYGATLTKSFWLLCNIADWWSSIVLAHFTLFSLFRTLVPSTHFQALRILNYTLKSLEAMSACQVPLEELLGSPTRATQVIFNFDSIITSSPTFFGSLASANRNLVVKHTKWTLLFKRKKMHRFYSSKFVLCTQQVHLLRPFVLLLQREKPM